MLYFLWMSWFDFFNMSTSTLSPDVYVVTMFTWTQIFSLKVWSEFKMFPVKMLIERFWSDVVQWERNCETDGKGVVYNNPYSKPHPCTPIGVTDFSESTVSWLSLPIMKNSTFFTAKISLMSQSSVLKYNPVVHLKRSPWLAIQYLTDMPNC